VEAGEIQARAHEGWKDEQEAMTGGEDARDNGGEVRWMAGLPGDDRLSFKEVESKTHDKSKRKGRCCGSREAVEHRMRG
jgi:hypothetical protein